MATRKRLQARKALGAWFEARFDDAIWAEMSNLPPYRILGWEWGEVWNSGFGECYAVRRYPISGREKDGLVYEVRNLQVFSEPLESWLVEQRKQARGRLTDELIAHFPHLPDVEDPNAKDKEGKPGGDAK